MRTFIIFLDGLLDAEIKNVRYVKKTIVKNNFVFCDNK